MVTALTALTMATAIRGATNAPPAPSLDKFLNAVTGIHPGMMESNALALLKTNGFPVVVGNGSNQVVSVSVGSSFFWITSVDLTGPNSYSVGLECVTTLRGPDHSHRSGIVKRVVIKHNGTNVVALVRTPSPKKRSKDAITTDSTVPPEGAPSDVQ